MLNLTDRQRKYLRTLAHVKKPVVIVGAAGVTEPVLSEIDAALDAHELIKVRVRAGDREARDSAIDLILTRTGAVNVQRVGHVLTMYRRNRDTPKLTLPH